MQSKFRGASRTHGLSADRHLEAYMQSVSDQYETIQYNHLVSCLATITSNGAEQRLNESSV